MTKWRILLGFLVTALPGILHAQRISGVENYAINRPGVVMIRTEYSAVVYVNSMKMDNRAFNALLDSIQKLDHAGGLTSEQKLDMVLREMNLKPARFFQTTFDYIKQSEQITATGTGFFVSGDGYVATNCHLIERDNAFIRRQFILSAFQQITDASIAALETSWATHFNETQRSLLYNTYASVYSRLFSMILYDLKRDTYVVYRSDREDSGAGTEKKLASVIRKGQPMPGKDVAILKIETDGEMPVLKLRKGVLPDVGEPLFVYGYPAPVTNNDYVAAASAIEPTLTTGIVSAVKRSVGGWPLIQMDANINHGSSGGPVCNEQGEVMGLTTFGSIENTGSLAAGLNFAVPVDILYEYIDSAGIQPGLSRSSVLFTEAVSLYEKSNYARALKLFQQVRHLNNHYPSLYVYIGRCQENIRMGRAQSPMPVGTMVAIVLLSLTALTGIAFWRSKRAR